MLQLIIIVIILVYLFSALVGAVRFWRDLKQFKTEIEFTGNREQLIDLMLKRKEITENDDRPEQSDNTAT